MDAMYEEKLHTVDKMSLCMDGSVYVDVRDNMDKWIRLEITKGDMALVPAGAYHRITLDSNVSVSDFLHYAKRNVLQMIINDAVMLAPPFLSKFQLN